MRRIIAYLLVFCIAFSLAGCGNRNDNASDDPRTVEKIVEEIAVDYGTYGAEAEDRINTLLKNLSDIVKEELVERLTAALNSAEKYPRAYVVCTGGGTASENESASEAGEMAKWLIGQGVEKNRVIVEDNSITTAQNAIFTYDILTSLYPSVKKLAIVSSDYHIATGELLFKAESILRANAPGNEKLEVISNAAWKAPSGSLSAMFQAGALIELFGDVETAFDIYYDNYDIHGLPPLH